MLVDQEMNHRTEDFVLMLECLNVSLEPLFEALFEALIQIAFEWRPGPNKKGR
jgi:hypothetical protein